MSATRALLLGAPGLREEEASPVTPNVVHTFTGSNGATVGTADSGHTTTALPTVWTIQDNKAAGSVAVNRALLWDYGDREATLEVEITPENNNNAGVILRALDQNNGFLVMVMTFLDRIRIYKRVAGVETLLRDYTSVTLNAGTAYNIKATIGDGVITPYVNGTALAEYTLTGGDEALFSGATSHGIWSDASGTAARWDNVNISQFLPGLDAPAFVQTGTAPVTLSAVTSVVSDGQFNMAPMLCIAANGDYLLSYRKGIDGLDPVTDPPGYSVYRRSTDQGVTWGSEVIFQQDENDNREVTFNLLQDGRISAVWATHSMDPWAWTPNDGWIRFSDDNGLTWGPDTNLLDDFTEMGKTVCGLVQRPNGDLLIPVSGEDPGSLRACRALLSTDDGVTWDTISRVTDGTVWSDEGFFIYQDDGTTLMALLRTNQGLSNGGATDACFSYDHGETWTRVGQMLESAQSRPNMVRMTDGRFILPARIPLVSGKPAGVFVGSADGLTWSQTPVLLYATAHQMKYAAIVEKSPGVALCIFARQITASRTDLESVLITLT